MKDKETVSLHKCEQFLSFKCECVTECKETVNLDLKYCKCVGCHVLPAKCDSCVDTIQSRIAELEKLDNEKKVAILNHLSRISELERYEKIAKGQLEKIRALNNTVGCHEKDIENLKALSVRLESRLSAANEFLERNGYGVEF